MEFQLFKDFHINWNLKIRFFKDFEAKRFLSTLNTKRMNFLLFLLNFMGVRHSKVINRPQTFHLKLFWFPHLKWCFRDFHTIQMRCFQSNPIDSKCLVIRFLWVSYNLKRLFLRSFIIFGLNLYFEGLHTIRRPLIGFR